MKSHSEPSGRRTSVQLFALLSSLLVAACNGDDGSDGEPGAPGGLQPPPVVAPGVDAPGVNVTILRLAGATGDGGNFEAGDRIRVDFTVKTDSGATWALDALSRGTILASGPTFNYQRIIGSQSDVLTRSTQNPDGSYSYKFADPIPSTYLPPLNDSPSFDADDGELSGQSLLDGTYTVGMYLRWDYTSAGDSEGDVGDTTFDFLVGPSATLSHREVVGMENCNACHQDLQFHGGQRRSTTLCLLCHTAGSEDKNNPLVAGGTPGVSVDFKVMIHKIHNGKHLPSVLGVTTLPSGARDYDATPEPYQLVGFGDSIHDYSDVTFPAWPNLDSPMPKDAGYSSLDPEDQDTEDIIREGVTSCYLCHGDPDGAGPIHAPAQGDQAYAVPTRNTCGSCHDDWVFDELYEANNQIMPAQLDDGACTLCHTASGSGLAVMEGHLHPLRDPSFAAGVNIDITSVSEAGANDGDGTIDPGESIELTFTIQDDTGADVDPATLSSLNTGLSGPSSVYQGFQYESIPTSVLTGPQPFTGNLPAKYWLEYQGDAAAGVDSFTTDKAPHLDPAVPTTVYERVGFGAGSTTLDEDSVGPANYIDVDDSSGFDRDDYIVINDGGLNQEYLQIQWVDGDRLWFSSPQTTTYPPSTWLTHFDGESVDEVMLNELTEGVEYDLMSFTGTIDETGGFTNGSAIVVSYTSYFEMPSEYPVALNAGMDLTEVQGGWAAKSIVDGTYSLAMWGRRNLTLDLFGESNSYAELARGVREDFLVGDADTIEPYDLISSADNCYACHVDLAFHGNNRRGFESCLSCHGTAAAGDRTRYVAENAPDTDGVNMNFRQLIHTLHMGHDLTNPTDYVVVGFGFLPYPNNFGLNTFEEIKYPAMPDGTKACESCHGSSDSWKEPSSLDHPTEQVDPSQPWTLSCGACHDSAEAQQHFADQTTPAGFETCSVCHDPSDDFSSEIVHKVR